jgi:ABC transport system ATP-binding/permease protein
MSNSTSINGTNWTIGKGRECDLFIDQPVVSNQHCRLGFHGDQYRLEDLGSTNGTYVNGYRLEPHTPVYVSRDDQITLGRNLPMPWPMAQQAHALPANLPITGPVINVGRAPENEITLDYPMISWRHARIFPSGKEWIIEDLSSANGTALNQIDNKITKATLSPTDEIYLGSYKIAASRILKERNLTQGEGAFEIVRLKGERMVLGRDPASGYPLDLPMVSWHHAAVERSAEGIYVEDLGSRNGTYVNGVRISGKTLVRPGQEIGLGSFRFRLLEDGALAKREYVGNVTIEVAGVTVNAPNGDRLLESISLTIFPSELVALMGPAGAGKTTFLKAVNGYTRPAGGNILFNGDDLYKYYDRFRLQMSYVPQDDIVHAQLTVREALYFSAKLRTDLRDDEIEQRIDSVLASLELPDKKNAIIGSPERKVLSGGQRKRVNIAMELIAAAPVIFLDEPTSGLSSYDAENVVKVLKKLSKDGTTIITTIHQPSLAIYKQFDNLIMISRDKGGRGALAYFGPAHPDAIEFFDPAAAAVQSTPGQPPKELSPEMLLSGLAAQPTANWVSKFDQSRYKKSFVTDRSGKIPSTPSEAVQSAVRKFGFGQWWTLVRRNFILKKRDTGQAVITLVQAPAFAILLAAVFRLIEYSDRNEYPKVPLHAIAAEFLMVVAAIWFGCNNVARDIVGEWTVYQRERMVSLKLPSYIFSKLAVAAVLNLFQCLVMLGIVTLFCHLKADFLAVLGILYLSSLVGSAIGLCVSARASTTEAAIAMLPLILLPMIALGGGLTPLKGMGSAMQLVAKIVPSRWAFEANLLLEAKASHYVPNDATPNGFQAPECHGEDLASRQFPKKEKDSDNKKGSDSQPVQSQTPKSGAGPKNVQPQQAAQPAPPTDSASCVVAKVEDPDRTSLSASFAVLGGMLVFWAGVALLFLRMRDIQ